MNLKFKDKLIVLFLFNQSVTEYKEVYLLFTTNKKCIGNYGSKLGNQDDRSYH